MNSRRESIWIIAEILELASNGATTSHIARKLGLNFPTAQRYAGQLLASGHLRRHVRMRSWFHEPTEKGESFLAELKAIKLKADEVLSLPRPSVVLAEAQSLPDFPMSGRRPFRAPLETPQ